MTPATFYNVSLSELNLLAQSQRTRCLGCGQAMDREGIWNPHGTCRGYYGAGARVDYYLFLTYVERSTNDGPIFDRWASAEPYVGVPSWLSRDELEEVL